MLPPRFTIGDEFPPSEYDAWRKLAEADLKGATIEQALVTHTYEGIDVQPLYTRRAPFVGRNSSSNQSQLGQATQPTHDPSGFPGFAPFVRGSQPEGVVTTGWDLRQEHAHPDLAATHQAILEDVQGGVTSLVLQLDKAARHGLDPDNEEADELAGHDGVMIYHVEDLDSALADIDARSIGVTLDGGAAFLPAAALLAAWWQRRGIAHDEVRGAFNADPLGTLASTGRLPYSPAKSMMLAADLTQWTAQNYAHVTAIGIDSSPYHDAGANDAQDVGFALATAIEYFRAMSAAGIDIDVAAKQCLFRFSLGTHHFTSISKLRAARKLWSRVVEVCGGSAPAGAMGMQVRMGRRVLARREPYVNLLRNSASVFAAGIGGADSITSIPFDAALGCPDSFGRRIARNTALILQAETHLHRTIDPAGGSWFLERLTDELAEKAWRVLQDVERQGGMLRALQSGWVAAQLAATCQLRTHDLASGKYILVGVNKYLDDGESQGQAPASEKVAIDCAALRLAAAQRLARIRSADCDSLWPEQSQVQPHSLGERTSAVVSAAEHGASVGQLSRGLDFHRENTVAPPMAPCQL